jgi:hypothetical protein
MVPELRDRFNANFTAEKYRAFLARLDEACGTHVKFRNSETPCFYPKSLLDQMAAYGEELIRQLMSNTAYLTASQNVVPAEFNVASESPHPEFIQVDFGLVRDADGNIEPKLVEIQGFPSLYAYQNTLAHEYISVYGLDRRLKFLLDGLEPESYVALLRRAILGDCEPESVVLMEIDPLEQKTLPDFLLTERLCGVKTVDAMDICKEGRRLFYNRSGKLVPIQRIYNRVIVDELIRKKKRLPFSLRDDLDVEWAGHPNWFFRLSKFSIPYLHHPCVPRTYLLDELDVLPNDPANYVLKPLFSFSGIGVVVGPTSEELAAIPQRKRSQYLLQERLDFEPLFQTPFGPTKAEARIMYIWTDTLRPGPVLVRMGRGKMMGVDYNRDMEWVGSSAGLYVDA